MTYPYLRLPVEVWMGFLISGDVLLVLEGEIDEVVDDGVERTLGAETFHS